MAALAGIQRNEPHLYRAYNGCHRRGRWRRFFRREIAGLQKLGKEFTVIRRSGIMDR